MGGSTTLGMGVGTVGLGWSQLGAFGDLNYYPAVMSFQITYNTVRTTSQALPAGRRITGGPINEDGQYGSETHSAMKKYIDFLVREGECAATSSTEIDRNGPNSARVCLLRTGMADATVTILQQAWREWKASTGGGGGGDGRPAPDPYASSRTACAASGGTWSDVTHTCTPAPAAESEGMGTGMWILLALVGALAAYGIYYVATES